MKKLQKIDLLYPGRLQPGTPILLAGEKVLLRWMISIPVILSFCAHAMPTLEQKLNLQFQKYQSARDLAVERSSHLELPLSERLVSRAEWEDRLALRGEWELSAEDLAALRFQHRAKVAAAKAAAVRNSVLNLAAVRKQHLSRLFCLAVPKGGMLHIHPHGTMDRPTGEYLLDHADPTLEISEILSQVDRSRGALSLSVEERDWLVEIAPHTKYSSLSPAKRARFTSFMFLPAGKQPFSRFNVIFNFLEYAISTPETTFVAFLNFAQKALSEGVSYVEFTSTVGMRALQGFTDLEKQTGLTIKVNQAFPRNESLDQLERRYAELAQMPNISILTGIDFVDNEERNPALEKGQLIYAQAFASNRFHRTMHAGELGDVRNPRDAMILGSERLGHAVNLRKDIVALEYASRTRVPVEINISSNLRLTDVPDVASHPFLDYLRLGLPVSLSTDDEGIFETDINRECELAVSQSDMQYSEFKQMAVNSLDTSFASASEKAELKARLLDRFSVFEQSFQRRLLGVR